MTQPGYVLTHAAEAGVRGIIQHMRKEWGDAQFRRYITRLVQGIARLAAGQKPFKQMGTLYPALRMAHCRHHYVFCLPRKKCSGADRGDYARTHRFAGPAGGPPAGVKHRRRRSRGSRTPTANCAGRPVSLLDNATMANRRTGNRRNQPRAAVSILRVVCLRRCYGFAFEPAWDRDSGRAARKFEDMKCFGTPFSAGVFLRKIIAEASSFR